MSGQQWLSCHERVAMVTGGGAGIGRACAQLLARLGADICLVDKDREAAHALEQSIRSFGRRAIAVVGDVREEATAAAAIEKTMATLGRLDFLVNNVGGMFQAAASDITAGGWSAVLRLNLDSTFFFSRAAAPAMRSSGGGSIVNIASVAGIAASPSAAHYGAAKAAVVNLTRTLALEWAPDIRVNCVAPDFILTEGTDRLMTHDDRERIANLIPLARLGTPEDVAGAVAFLVSPLAAFITGHTLVVDGGSLYRGRMDFAPSPK